MREVSTLRLHRLLPILLIGAVGALGVASAAIAADPVSVPDLFATILAGMGINPNKSIVDNERPIPLTDNGVPIAKLFV